MTAVANDWNGYLAAAEGHPREAEILAEACLAYSRLMPASTFEPRAGGAPAGRPDGVLARAVAARLLELRPVSVPGAPAIQRILGLLASGAAPAAGTGRSALLPSLAAVEEAEALGDRDVLRWALADAARRAWTVGDHQCAAALAARVTEDHDPERIPNDPWAVAPAAGNPPWLPEPWITRAVTAADAAAIAVQCAGKVGDFDARTSAHDMRMRCSEPLRTARPRIYARALQGKAMLCRAFGDWQGVRRAEAALSELAKQEGPEREAARTLAASRVGTAEVMNDYSAVFELERQRIELVLDIVRSCAEEGAELETERDVLAYLKHRGDRAYRAALGNARLAQAASLYHLGLTGTDPERRAEALECLDLVDAAYEGYGNNGSTAARRSRARIFHQAGLMSTEDFVQLLLETASTGLQGGLRRNAVLEAVRVCVPGDVRVRDRVLEGLAGPVSTHTGRYRAAWALWLSKAAAAVEEQGGRGDWGEVLEAASRAGEELVVGGRLVAPLLSLQVWEAAWRAHERLHGESGLGSRMALALNAVHALATQLVTLTQAAERSRVAGEHARVFPDAAALAVQLGDPVAAELVMEAARRERVGLLLGELAHNPEVGHAVREAAEGIVVANSAAPEEGSFKDGDGSRALAWQTRSADAIQGSRERAVAAAAAVIGPAAALADLSRIPVPVAADLARESAAPGSESAVLQLYRPPADPTVVFWALALPGGELSCGRGELPGPLPVIEDEGFWAKAHDLAPVLLPEPLRQHLLAGRGGPPLRLTIVPTGLLGIPFDQLPLDDELFLLDRADTVLTGSLAMARALHTLPAPPDAKEWVSAYDHLRLAHARTESQSLAQSHAPLPLLEVTGREGLFAALDPSAPTRGLLALGLHGSGDESGWAQAKLLPDGSTVTAAEALRWAAPRVAVLSSCHSKLETVDGTELSGFPAALLLRGSSTVIGSLTKIDDRATAQIVSRFWAHTAHGHDPAHALAQAKRDWLQDNPHHTPHHWLWAPLIAYGTHTP